MKPKTTKSLHSCCFYVFKLTSGQLSLEEKNKISHRALAFNKLIKLIKLTWSNYEKSFYGNYHSYVTFILP